MIISYLNFELCVLCLPHYTAIASEASLKEISFVKTQLFSDHSVDRSSVWGILKANWLFRYVVLVLQTNRFLPLSIKVKNKMRRILLYV